MDDHQRAVESIDRLLLLVHNMKKLAAKGKSKVLKDAVANNLRVAQEELAIVTRWAQS